MSLAVFFQAMGAANPHDSPGDFCRWERSSYVLQISRLLQREAASSRTR